VDPRLAFLQRAAARLLLVEAGEMEVETAIQGLIEPFEQLVGPLLCDCTRETSVHWESTNQQIESQQPAEPRSAPQATIEAVIFCVRERGVQALKERANIERLRSCDEAAKAQINARIEKLIKQAASNG
jgi:hypothetical protein